MKKLKRSIMLSFIKSTVFLTVTELLLALLLREGLMSYYGISGTVAVAAGTVIVNIIFAAALIMVGPAAWLFSRMLTRKLNAEIQRQANERNMLYANIAHDLKTPMTSILGYAKALEDHKVEPAQNGIVINRIYQKAKQTDELLNMLFEYAKLQTDEYPLNLQKADLCSLVRHVAAGLYEFFEERNIRFEAVIPDAKIEVFCDVMQMKRAVGNLIINAYRHNEDGSRAGVMVKEKTGKAYVIIADTGKDISPEEAELLFFPFVSGDDVRSGANGSGLGLAIARRIAEKHGGTLTVEHNESGYVKEFVICLDAAERRK